jgi:hypothetical protein
VPEVRYIIKRACVIEFGSPLGLPSQLARVTYTGGYVLPGVAPQAGQTPLPAEIEQAATEQTAYWFQNRDRIGLERLWEYHGTYRQFANLDLLESVKAVLRPYQRMTL